MSDFEKAAIFMAALLAVVALWFIASQLEKIAKHLERISQRRD